MAAHGQVLSIVRNVSWAHGRFDLIEAQKPQGLVRQWIDGWRPTDDREVCLVLEDDMIVSPQFYRWLKPLITRFAHVGGGRVGDSEGC